MKIVLVLAAVLLSGCGPSDPSYWNETMDRVYACHVEAAQTVGVDFTEPVTFRDLETIAEIRAQCIVDAGIVDEKAAALCLVLHDNYSDYADCLDESGPQDRTANCRNEHENDDEEYQECMERPLVTLRSSYEPRSKR